MWQRQVRPNKVLNLTNKVNTLQLEILSLGLDLKLKPGNKNLLDIYVAFQQYDYRYRNESQKPDLHFAKTHLISKISKDFNKVLPKRYFDAIRKLGLNKDIMVLQSDKGKQCVVWPTCTRDEILVI